MFLELVQKDLCLPGKSLVGMKWDDLIIRSEWKKRIIDFLNFDKLSGYEILVEMTTYYPC